MVRSKSEVTGDVLIIDDEKQSEILDLCNFCSKEIDEIEKLLVVNRLLRGLKRALFRQNTNN